MITTEEVEATLNRYWPGVKPTVQPHTSGIDYTVKIGDLFSVFVSVKVRPIIVKEKIGQIRASFTLVNGNKKQVLSSIHTDDKHKFHEFVFGATTYLTELVDTITKSQIPEEEKYVNPFQ